MSMKVKWNSFTPLQVPASLFPLWKNVIGILPLYRREGYYETSGLSNHKVYIIFYRWYCHCLFFSHPVTYYPLRLHRTHTVVTDYISHWKTSNVENNLVRHHHMSHNDLHWYPDCEYP